jgi:large subunit ribosomal protein L9
MQIILTKDVPGLGRAGDIKEVSDGYARNFIIGKKFGVAATQSQLGKINKEQKEKSDKEARLEAKQTQLYNKINNQTITLKRSANGSKLFAGIHEQDIIKEIRARFGVELVAKQVKILNAIKTTGSHPVKLKLTDRHQAALTVKVEPQ